jgi:AraC-like DNA-binding protein/DNA-binding NarL/FixJ family response regulator
MAADAKLLIVDDEDNMRLGVETYIRTHSELVRTVYTACNGIEATNAISEFRPDYMLIDIKMPYKDGLAVIRDAQRMNICPKTVIISGYDSFEYARQALRLGVEDYLLKPCRPNEILEKIETMILRDRGACAGADAGLAADPGSAAPVAAQVAARVDGLPEGAGGAAVGAANVAADGAANGVTNGAADGVANSVTNGEGDSAADGGRDADPGADPGAGLAVRPSAEAGIGGGDACAGDASPGADKPDAKSGDASPGADKPDAKSGDAYNRFVDIAMKYMSEHFSEDISLPLVAEIVGITPSYLSALFTQTLQYGFSDYLNKLRIDKACALLYNPTLKAYEAAYRVGFNDERYFARVFKRITGVNPSQYQKSLQNSKGSY